MFLIETFFSIVYYINIENVLANNINIIKTSCITFLYNEKQFYNILIIVMKKIIILERLKEMI